MLEQTIVVTVLVIGCSAYAVWTLMPTSARRIVARALLKLPLPRHTAAALQKHLVAVGGCGGCGGCGQKPKKHSAPAVQSVRLHPRRKS